MISAPGKASITWRTKGSLLEPGAGLCRLAPLALVGGPRPPPPWMSISQGRPVHSFSRPDSRCGRLEGAPSARAKLNWPGLTSMGRI